MTDDDLIELSAVAAVSAMRTGALTAEDYATALLARCATGSGLNAFIALDPDAVLAAARRADNDRRAGAPLGAMHGLPVPIKDSINTADLATTAGTRALRQFRPKADAPAVAKLRAAGAIVLGKTNLHELSFGWTNNNLAFGAVRNPYDPSRIPGGSSGGTAAAVAARMAPLGVAEDTQGSIRVPAALCGVAGFRPTTGRYPNAGAAPITPLFDQVGPIARGVGDLALFDAVMTGDDRPVGPAVFAGLRLGIDRDYYFAGLDAGVAQLVDDAIVRLRDAGVVIVERPVAGLAGSIAAITAPIQLHDVAPSLARYFADYGAPADFAAVVEQLSDDVRATFAQFVFPGAPHRVSEAAYLAARDVHLPALQRTMAAHLAEHRLDALLLPATMIAAPLIGDDRHVMIGGSEVPFATAIARNISPGSTIGLPGVVLPVGLTADTSLPVALELDGRPGGDRELLAIAMAIEAILSPIAAPRPDRWVTVATPRSCD